MKKLLFITNRNILTTAGELRLIKNRAESLYNNYGITTDFIAIGSKQRINSIQRETINAGGPIIEIASSLSNILSFIFRFGTTYETITSKLKNHNYDAVILSGPGMTLYTKLIKKFHLKVFIDIHGALEDMLELSSSASFAKSIFFRLLYRVSHYEFRRYLKYADGCFVVTKSLENYIRGRIELSNNFPFYIVPCATTGLSNIIKNKQEYRDKYRLKYGIDDKTIVFVYSGGVSPWQCVDETISLYMKIADQLDVHSKMLLLSHNVNVLRELVGEDQRFIIDSHKPETLREVLCMADYAFMLRKDCPTNNVAFPNKFLEYVESGLNIITTPYVFEIHSQIEKFGLGIIIDNLTDSTTVVNMIESNKQYGIDVVENVFKYNSFKSRLSSFVSAL